MTFNSEQGNANQRLTTTWYPGFKDQEEAVKRCAHVSFKCWVDQPSAASMDEEASSSCDNSNKQQECVVSFGVSRSFTCTISLDAQALTALDSIPTTTTGVLNPPTSSFVPPPPIGRSRSKSESSRLKEPIGRCRSKSESSSLKEPVRCSKDRKSALQNIKENDWCVWTDYMPTDLEKGMSQIAFQGRIEHTGGFQSIEEFQKRFGHRFLHPREGMALRVFRSGIQPLWEDQANRGARSGKWVIQSSCKWVLMLATFRRILGRMVSGEVTGINGIISKVRRGKHMVMLWTQAHTSKSDDPFEIRQMVADIATQIGVELSVSFKSHKGHKKKSNSATSSPMCSPMSSPLLSYTDSDYDNSPVLSPILGSSLIPTPVDRPPLLSLADFAGAHDKSFGSPIPKISVATSPRALSWAHRSMRVTRV